MPNLIWVTIENPEVKPINDGTPLTNNLQFNSFLTSHGVSYWGQAFPGARNEIVQRIFELRFDSCNVDSFITQMSSTFPNLFSTYRKQEILPNISVYDPVDYMWWLTTQNPNDWLWHIKKIQGDLAWDITHGNANIKIGLLDTQFDITHPDLQNKFVYSYDPYDMVPFNCTPVYWHGTTVASFAAGETIEQGNSGNSGQLASIGFNTMLIGYNAWAGSYLQRAWHAAFTENVDIITSSAGGWSSCPDPSGQDALVVKDILDHGTVIIMPAGNGINGTHNFCAQVDPVNDCPFFPLSPYYDSRIIIVTGTDKNDNHHYLNPGNGQDDTHSHYPMVDICAPGHELLGAALTSCGSNTWPYFGGFGGTSFATPIVAGTAALMLAVNGCLTSSSIEDIIKSTADPVTDAANYPGKVGAGRINAYQAVLAAQGMYSSSLDLSMKDIPHDFGVEPDPDNGPMWISDDIWVRNQNDGFTNQVNQNPEYWINPLIDNYVYVRVRNKSCTDFISTSSDLLHLHWAKAASALSWPNYWYTSFGITCGGGAPMGDEMPSSPQQIPNIPAGGEVILEFPWHVPDPALYNGCNPEPWHFCLLSRIDSPQDPMTFSEVASVYDNAKNNNNIIWKNLTVVDNLPGIVHNEDCYSDRQVGGVIAVGNPFNVDDNYKLEFKLDDKNRGIPIFEQAEIKITLDDLTWQKWADGGYQADNIKIKREDCKQLVITGNPASLKNLTYAGSERSTLNLSFNFLTDKVDATPQFDYHVIQRRSQGDKIIGGELYRIQKPSRNLFGADAGGDKNISENQSVTLSANTIGETAYYNWYDPDGNLIYSGKDFTVSPSITTKYKLEVIASSDGFASYDSLTVKIKDCEIQSITPNPATTQITVQYKAQNVSSGYLVITHPSGSPNNNYILNLNQNTKVINVSNYAAGNYNLILVCDGVVKDQKVLSIQ